MPSGRPTLSKKNSPDHTEKLEGFGFDIIDRSGSSKQQTAAPNVYRAQDGFSKKDRAKELAEVEPHDPGDVADGVRRSERKECPSGNERESPRRLHSAVN